MKRIVQFFKTSDLDDDNVHRDDDSGKWRMVGISGRSCQAFWTLVGVKLNQNV